MATIKCAKSPPPFRLARKAYLNRQYTTIGIVGVVLFVVIGFLLGWKTALGFAICHCFRSCGLYRHERFSARNVRTAGSREAGVNPR